MPHGPVKYMADCSRRAAQGSLYRGAGRQRRSERLKVGPYDGPERGVFYEPRATRGDVVALSLSRRNAASESEAACETSQSASLTAPLSGEPYAPRLGRFFLRAEGYSKRCCQFESDAAQRHLSPKRPATGDRRTAKKGLSNATAPFFLQAYTNSMITIGAASP